MYHCHSVGTRTSVCMKNWYYAGENTVLCAGKLQCIKGCCIVLSCNIVSTCCRLHIINTGFRKKSGAFLTFWLKMEDPKKGVKLGLESAAKSTKMKYCENPTFFGKLDFWFFGEFQTFQMILRWKNHFLAWIRIGIQFGVPEFKSGNSLTAEIQTKWFLLLLTF